MKRIGLTGGIGMGKSAVGDMMVNLGVPLIDTDVVARQVVSPGQPAHRDIVSQFGKEFLLSDNSLDRQKLASIVFSDPDKLAILNRITHPEIRRMWISQLESWEKSGAAASIVVIPLLFEIKAEAEFDLVVSVGCSEQTQRSRLEARGWSSEHLESRLQSQMNPREKWNRSQVLIWTDCSLNTTEWQVNQLIRRITTEKTNPQ